MIRHIVALRLRANLPAEDKSAVLAELAALKDKIDGVLAFHSFANISVEQPVVHGFLDLFWFDFRDTTVRDAYLIHPAHQAAARNLVAACEDGPQGIVVMDVDLGDTDQT